MASKGVTTDKVIRDETIEGIHFQIIQLSEHSFIVRQGIKTVAISTTLEGIEEKYANLLNKLETGGDKDMTGKEKLDEQMQKLKDEKAEKEAVELANKAQIRSELAKISPNDELAKMMAQDAMLGSENLRGAALPVMKVTAAGKSSNFLENGKRAADGLFYYSPLKEEFETLTVNILTVSRGFYLIPPSKEGEDVKEPKFNQVVGGVFEYQGSLKPFVMFFQGKKWKALNDFTKEASQYTHMKPIPIPMFSLSVTLTVSQEDNETHGGYLHIVDFAIEKSENGMPMIVTDAKQYGYLRSAIVKAQDLIEGYITANEVADPRGNKEKAATVTTASTPVEEVIDDEPDADDGKETEVAPDDIPF
jgi:hypothetical protein